jgi:hypothetical protein
MFFIFFKYDEWSIINQKVDGDNNLNTEGISGFCQHKYRSLNYI